MPVSEKRKARWNFSGPGNQYFVFFFAGGAVFFAGVVVVVPVVAVVPVVPIVLGVPDVPIVDVPVVPMVPIAPVVDVSVVDMVPLVLVDIVLVVEVMLVLDIAVSVAVVSSFLQPNANMATTTTATNVIERDFFIVRFSSVFVITKATRGGNVSASRSRGAIV